MEVDNPGTDGVPQTTLKPSGRTDPVPTTTTKKTESSPSPPSNLQPPSNQGATTTPSIPSVPSSANMSDFPDTLPSFDRARERPPPESVSFDSKAVTEQKEFMKVVRRQGKQRKGLVQGHDKVSYIHTLTPYIHTSIAFISIHLHHR